MIRISIVLSASVVVLLSAYLRSRPSAMARQFGQELSEASLERSVGTSACETRKVKKFAACYEPANFCKDASSSEATCTNTEFHSLCNTETTWTAVSNGTDCNAEWDDGVSCDDVYDTAPCVWDEDGDPKCSAGMTSNSDLTCDGSKNIPKNDC